MGFERALRWFAIMLVISCELETGRGGFIGYLDWRWCALEHDGVKLA